jgi:hypothetical protein
MITYKIISNVSDKQLKECLRDPKHPNYKKAVYERAITHNTLRVGNKIKFHGKTKYRGVISRIIKDFDEIEWYNNQPLFIEMEYLDDNNEKRYVYVHPSHVRKL